MGNSYFLVEILTQWTNFSTNKVALLRMLLKQSQKHQRSFTFKKIKILMLGIRLYLILPYRLVHLARKDLWNLRGNIKLPSIYFSRFNKKKGNIINSWNMMNRISKLLLKLNNSKSKMNHKYKKRYKWKEKNSSVEVILLITAIISLWCNTDREEKNGTIS